jgi:two-component system, NtrC family, sensor histidine kinase KinB
MKIKTKLTLGVGLLFLLIIVLGVVGARYSMALKEDTNNILVANYNTLLYTRYMLDALDEGTGKAMRRFEENLRKQEGNLTEIGEEEVTRQLRALYGDYRTQPRDSAVIRSIRQEIFRIMDMNMQAIQRKSDLARSTADRAVFWIAFTSTLCFLIAFSLLLNLPTSIASPIQELTASIKQIAAENYAQRVHFEDHSEFGQLARSFNTMAEKLEEYNSSNLARLMMEKKRIETLINNMHDPVVGLDEQMHVLFANGEALKVLALGADGLIGKDAREVALHNDLLRSLLVEMKPGEGEIRDQSTLKIYADDREGYFEKEILDITIVPTGETRPRLVGHVIILRNVTVHKELDVAKTNFISTVSHEFKTPISSIKMSVQLLENDRVGSLNEEQRNLLDSIKDDAQRLLRITAELLNITQVESGNIQLSLLPTHPREVLAYALEANKVPAEQKKITLDIDSPKGLPRILADSEKTAWVLTNLISNAIRYSYEHATVYIGIRKTEGGVQFLVRDTGQGIAQQYREKIFDRYFRVPGTRKEGTGLGLAISKEFIEAQGGQITLESELGAGSTFTVTLNGLAETD